MGEEEGPQYPIELSSSAGDFFQKRFNLRIDPLANKLDHS